MYAPKDLPFKIICEFLEACVAHRRLVARHMTHFREKYLPPNDPDVFEVYRLIIPKVWPELH
jgi:hypothetical protein